MLKLLTLLIILLFPLAHEPDTTKNVIQKKINLKEQINKQNTLNAKLDSLIIKRDTIK